MKPSDDPAYLDDYYATHYAHRNPPSCGSPEEKMAYFARFYREYLPLDTGEPILEIGCGTGDLLLYLKSLGYTQTYGIDASRSMVEQCAKRGLEVELADGLEYLERTHINFSQVFMLDVIEHIPKSHLTHLLNMLHGNLLPGGTIVLTTPNMSNPLNLRSRYVDITHTVGFAKEALEQMLRKAGFEIVVVKGLYTPHSRWYARLLYDKLILALFERVLRGTFRLYYEIVPGKNLLAVGRKLLG